MAVTINDNVDDHDDVDHDDDDDDDKPIYRAFNNEQYTYQLNPSLSSSLHFLIKIRGISP